MSDPKPELSRAAIEANISYCHARLDALDAERDLVKEQLDHWLVLKSQLK